LRFSELALARIDRSELQVIAPLPISYTKPIVRTEKKITPTQNPYAPTTFRETASG